MTTRSSTPKHEVVHTDGLIVLGGVSRTEATAFARAMNKGSKVKRFSVRRVRKTFICETCADPTTNPEDDYGEHVCNNCQQNKAEAAYERHCEDFHDGGCTRFKSLQDQQIEARRFK